MYNAEISITGRQILSKSKQAALDKLTREEKLRNEVFTPNQKEWYVGMSKNTMKERISTHNSNCKLSNYEHTTELSKYVWKLKRHGYLYDIKWRILATAKPYNPASKICNLCSKEKYFIIYRPEIATLNKNSELLKKCPHRIDWLIGVT